MAIMDEQYQAKFMDYQLNTDHRERLSYCVIVKVKITFRLGC